MRIKEQETCLSLQERDDGDDNIRFCKENKNLCPHFLKHPFIRRHAEDTLGTAVAQWLRCCATTNRKVAGSIPVGVTGIFH